MICAHGREEGHLCPHCMQCDKSEDVMSILGALTEWAEAAAPKLQAYLEKEKGYPVQIDADGDIRRARAFLSRVVKPT